MDCSGLKIHPDQEFEIWGMRPDPDHLQIAFDAGDNGFVRLTLLEASELLVRLSTGKPVNVCGYELTATQKAELTETIRVLLEAN